MKILNRFKSNLNLLVKNYSTKTVLYFKINFKNMVNIFQWPDENNIYRYSFPSYYYGRMTGYLFFTVVGDWKNGKIKSTIFDYFNFLLILTIHLFIIYANITFDIKTIHSNSVIIEFGHRFILFVGIINVTLTKIISVFMKNKIWSIVGMIYKFDMGLEILGQKTNHIFQGRVVIGIVVASFSCFFFALFFGAYFLFGVYDVNILYICTTQAVINLSYATLMGTFWFLTLAVYTRFWNFNKLIRYE